MKPAPFLYRAPGTVADALALKALHGEEARFLAGGQSLVPAMNFRVAQPAILLDLNRVAGLDAIVVAPDGSARIGATARHRAVERHPGLARSHPILAEALAEVAHPQVRNRGTIGGNLSHADPASEMPAVMVALDARYRLASASGERWVAARDFATGALSTALRADEMLAEIALPALPPRTGTAFLELARRRGDYPMAGVAAVVTLRPDGTCASAAIALCNAADRPVAVDAAGLCGRAMDAAAFRDAAALARDAADPPGNVHATPAYQRHLLGVLTERALALAASRA